MRSLACLGALLFVALTAVASAEPVFPRGGGVGLEPPPGMQVSKDFLGFRKGMASILIAEMPPAAFAQIAAQRAQFVEKLEGGTAEDFAVGGARGFIVRGKQSRENLVFRKWAAVLGAPTTTVMVTAQVPVGEEDITDAAVEAALRSIVLRGRPDMDAQVAALPFVVGDLAGFRITHTLMGASLLLTEGPKDEDPGITQPNIVVSTSLSSPPPQAQRAAFAKNFLLSVRPLWNVVIESADLFEVAGAQWAQVRAKAVTGKADVPINVALFLRFGDSDYIAVIGTAPQTKPDYAGRFRQLALSVGPRG